MSPPKGSLISELRRVYNSTNNEFQPIWDNVKSAKHLSYLTPSSGGRRGVPKTVKTAKIFQRNRKTASEFS